MRRLILAAAGGLGLLLGACAAPDRVDGFRRPAAPIWSAAAFAPARIEGVWTQAATLSGGPGPGCAPGAVSFARTDGGMAVSGNLCLNGQVVPVAGAAAIAGPGRLSVPGMEDWWVIWVDADYRTLAVATPSGRFGFVLDIGKISPDRLVAAREIFEFNGHAGARLMPF